MDKINARDLRVGNWVHCITDNANHRIDSYGIVYGNPWYIYDGKINILSDIEPIPITKEILEKNGFKEGRFGLYSYRLVDGDDKVYLNGTFTELEYTNVCHNYDDPDEVNYGSNMEFPKPLELHQLQNILQDLGVEKEINV